MLQVVCRSLTSFSSCGRLTDDLLGDGARPVKDYLLCTSEAPAMAWIQFSNLRRKRAQSNSTPPECSKAGTPALEMAAQWAAQGIVKFVNAVDGVQGTAIPYSAEETWVIVGMSCNTALMNHPVGDSPSCCSHGDALVQTIVTCRTLLYPRIDSWQLAQTIKAA